MKNYKIVQLEEMLGYVYSGRADIAMIDELIAYLLLRRNVITNPKTLQDIMDKVVHKIDEKDNDISNDRKYY